MIDLQVEKPIALKEAPDHLPKRRSKKVHYSTVYRWATKGARGKKLETVRIGGIRYTTLEALERFFDSDPAMIRQTNIEASAVESVLKNAGV